MLSRVKDYYKNDKERLRQQKKINIETYLKKIKKRENMKKNRYHNMSEEKKHELKEYQKRRYHEAKKSKNNN